MSISALTNKHVIAALIVTPILAIIAYFAVDYAVSEKPQSAVAGNSYPLIAKSNCRYESGVCTFKNGDVEFDIISKPINQEQLSVEIDSQLPLDGVKISLANNGAAAPQTMSSMNSAQTQWQTSLATAKLENSKLYVVVSANKSLYYGETEMTFTTYETSFPQSNMK